MRGVGPPSSVGRGRDRRLVRRAARLGPAPEEVTRGRGRALEVRAVRGAVLALAVDPARAILAVVERAGEDAAELAVAVDELAKQHRGAVAALAVDAANVAGALAVLVGDHAQE